MAVSNPARSRLRIDSLARSTSRRISRVSASKGFIAANSAGKSIELRSNGWRSGPHGSSSDIGLISAARSNSAMHDCLFQPEQLDYARHLLYRQRQSSNAMKSG